MVLQTEQPKRKSNICILADSGVGVIGMLLLSHENSISYPLGYWLPCPNVAHHNIRSVGWYAHPDGGGAGGGGGGAAHFRSSHGFNYALTAYPEIQLHSITMAGPNMTVSALAMARCPLAVGCRLLAVWPPGGTSSVMDIFWTMALVKIQSANCCASFAMPTTVVVDLDWALDPDLGDNQCDLARQLNSCQCEKKPNGTSSLWAAFFANGHAGYHLCLISCLLMRQVFLLLLTNWLCHLQALNFLLDSLSWPASAEYVL